MSKYAFGVDIGGTSIKLGMFDENGLLLDKWEVPTNTANEGAAILPDAARSIKAKMQQKGIDQADVIGVGICTPGPVDDEGTVNRAVNLNWGRFNVPKVFKAYLDVPVKVGNDANVAAYGEMWQGGGKGCKNMVMVTLGTGVGGGIINNGEILNGFGGCGGEIGHIHIQDGEEEKCGCGNQGCLEQYTSATGIVRLANRRLAKDDEPSVLRGCKISAKTVFDGVKAGDKVAIEIACQFGEYLGKGLAIIAAVVDPEVFVIGGGVSNAGSVLFDYIRPAYEKYAFHGTRNVGLALATLGNDAGIVGAAGIVLGNHERERAEA